MEGVWLFSQTRNKKEQPMPELGKPDIRKLKEEGNIEELVAALELDDKTVQRKAIEALGAIESPEAIDALTALVENESRTIRESAVKTLGKTGDPKAVKPLILCLKDKDEYVRMFAASSLVEIGGPSIQPLIEALQNENPDVRKFATNALVKIGDPVIKPLMNCLEDESESSIRRVLAAATFVEMGARAVRPLSEALGSNDQDVRKYARWALDELKRKGMETGG